MIEKIFPKQFIPSWSTFKEGGVSARMGDIFSSHFPKFSSTTRQYMYILLGGALLIGFSSMLFRYLKPTFKKISLAWRMYQIYRRVQNPVSSSPAIDNLLMAYIKEGKDFEGLSIAIQKLSSQDQQNAFQCVEKQALNHLKSLSFTDLLQHYRRTYVRGGRYEDPQRGTVWPELIIPYVQKWRTEVLAKALIQNFKSQITIDVLNPSYPADKELQLLAEKS